MKILLVTWTWYPVGGDWTYVKNVKRLYEENGYEVIPFSTRNDKNEKSDYEEYLVDSFDYKELNENKNLVNGVKAVTSSIISFDALKKITLLIKEHNISFAHFHIIHHYITPAIIWKLHKAGIPIIWTLHEYKLICPEITFVSNGEICEKCFDNKFFNCAINKCKKNSYAASFLASVDAYFYNSLHIYDKVDFFLCPSQFLLNKYKQFNFPESKLTLTNYCYDIVSLDNQINDLRINEVNNDNQKYILYVGRIEKVKGVLTLIKAVSNTDIVLKIAGTGSLLDSVVQYLSDNNLVNVEILGLKDKKSVYQLTDNALCVVCPSEWYENYPFSVIESMLLSKAVIGSRIGGIPELIVDGETGYLFEFGNEIQLKEKLLALWNNPELAIEFGKAGREYIYGKVNFETHWYILKEIIDKLNVKQPEIIS